MTKKTQNNNLIVLGTIVNTFGLKGELKVLTNSSFINERFKKGAKIFYLENSNFVELQVNSYRMSKNNVIVSFKDLNHINEVLFLKNKEIYCIKDEVKLKKGQFFYNDLIGFKAIDQNRNEIGIVESFWFNNFFYNVNIKYKKGIINIPMVKEFLIQVDFKKKELNLNIPNEYLN